jgi:hypothetical protein
MKINSIDMLQITYLFSNVCNVVYAKFRPKHVPLFLFSFIFSAFFYLYMTQGLVREDNIGDQLLWLGLFFTLLCIGIFGEKRK